MTKPKELNSAAEGAQSQDETLEQVLHPATLTAPQGRPSRARDLVFVFNYKLTDVPPASIEYSRCMVRFQGFNPVKANPDLLWGVQGTTSLRDADRYAASDAAFRKLRIFQLELAYRIPNLTAMETSISEEAARRFGYLHYSRLTSGYKETLRKRMNQWVFEDKDPEYTRLQALAFEELIRQRPMLIHRLMSEDTFLNLVVHPVLLNGGVSMRIATVRRKPEFIDRISVRFHEEIATTI